MDRNKEIDIIINEINRRVKEFDADKFIMVTINQDHKTGMKDYEFSTLNDTEIIELEATPNLIVLNRVIQYLLNNGYIIDFEFNLYWGI